MSLSGKKPRQKTKTIFSLSAALCFAIPAVVCLRPATKKGHTYYYCTNGKGKCEQHKKYLNKDKANELMAGLFEKVKFKAEDIEIAYLAL